MRIGALVLAAGDSRRMGRNKQMLPYGESTVIETILSVLRETPVDGVTVVLGRSWEEVWGAIDGLDVEMFVNPRPENGMLSSVQWGLAQMRDDLDGFLIVLGDQPQIRAETVTALIQVAEKHPKSIFLPTYRGRRGHPVLFRASLKKAILDLPLTGGLNRLLADLPEEVQEVPVDSDTVLKDIDTPEDYRRALEEAEGAKG
jgi:molybdenum cofactor cytidylyltransferase